MDRDTLRLIIKGGIPCTDYLKPAPNFSAHNNTGYCCPICGSGTHGAGSDGAVKYYPDTNTWHCFSCDRGGDVIDAYSAATGSDHNEAIAYLATQMGLDTDSRPVKTSTERTERPQGDEKKTIDKLPNKDTKPAENVNQHDFTEYYKTCSDRLNDPAAISYLKARGISIETARRFNIGYDPAADPATAPGATSNEYKAHPTPRIIAPCTNDFYIARSVDPVADKYKAPNPKGTHTQLFNAAAMYSAQTVFICEGIFDALSFEETGHAAIATNGKGNGKLILKQLEERPTTAKFIIVPDFELTKDGDPDLEKQTDTNKKAEELNDQLQAMGVKSIVYNMVAEYKAAAEESKEIKDANDVLKADRVSFEQIIEAAIYELQRDDLTDFFEKIQTEAYKAEETGLRFFDKLLGGGILPQSLLTLLAAPAAGKTALCQQIAERMAPKGRPFIYLNLEMSREQMFARAISTRLYYNGYSIGAKQILQGYKWTESDRKSITQAINEYRRDIYPYLKYNPANVGSNLENILQYLDRIGTAALTAGEPAPAIVIDYLHKLTSSDKNIKGDAGETVKKAVDGLKQYAIKYNTFVITIGAVNRDAMKNGRIDINSGRDTSGIEYEGDYILTLNYDDIDSGKVKINTPEYDELKKAPQRKMILRLEKGRFDQPAKATNAMFIADSTTFKDMDAYDRW